MRRALRLSAVFNLGGALAFAFPASLGRLVDLPGPVPPLFSASLAMMVALFGGAYAWLARQPRIDRPMVALSAIGKTAFVAIAFACWLLREASGLFLFAASGDLVFAAIFAWWLAGADTPRASEGPSGGVP